MEDTKDPRKENEPLKEENSVKPADIGVDPQSEKGGDMPYLFSQLVFILKLIFNSFKELVLKFINIRDSTDIRKTINNIHSGIELKGYNIWILIASAGLACIGLDTNSGPIIIGAMLISPLMSPILGIGLAIGMNDRTILFRSAYNFGIAVAISLGTAFIYFLLSPLANETPEILSRTTPTVLDVMVGFFGGVAGIVAGSRREITNAIPGVAIATALMPPLCVAGYGLATFQFHYFAGAFYLFFLNVVFISLATFLIVRFLNFPLKSEVTLNLLKNFKIGVVIFVLVVLIPAVVIFIGVIKDQREAYRIQSFTNDKFPNTDFAVEKTQVIERDDTTFLMISIAGAKYISNDTIESWQSQLDSRYGLGKMLLRIFQSKSNPNDREQIAQAMHAEINRRFDEYEQDRSRWLTAQDEVERLRAELKSVREGSLPILEIREDIQDFVPECVSFEVGEVRVCDLSDVANRDPGKDESVLTVGLIWLDSLNAGVMEDRKKLLAKRIREKYKIGNLRLVDMNTPLIIYDIDGGDDSVDTEE